MYKRGVVGGGVPTHGSRTLKNRNNVHGDENSMFKFHGNLRSKRTAHA